MSEQANLIPVEVVADGVSSLPKWKRTILVETHSKAVYIPAAASPSGEFWAQLAATWDGQPIVGYRNHAFLDLAWMRQEYPEWSEVYDAIQGNADRAFREIAAGTL